MCKSASSVLFWYTRQLVSAQFGDTAQKELRELTASGKIQGVGEFVNPVTDDVLESLLQLSREQGPLVVKAHCLLTDRIRAAIAGEGVKVVFSYRDPRDMILSAIDHHRRSVETSNRQVFREFTKVKDSIEPAKWWCEMACEWVDSQLPLPLTYSEIVARPAAQIKRVAEFLGVETTAEFIDSLIAKENESRATGKNEFNKGDLVRYKNEMTPEEIFMCDRELGKYILGLGYDVDPAHLEPRKPFASRQLRNLKKLVRKYSSANLM